MCICTMGIFVVKLSLHFWNSFLGILGFLFCTRPFFWERSIFFPCNPLFFPHSIYPLGSKPQPSWILRLILSFLHRANSSMKDVLTSQRTRTSWRMSYPINFEPKGQRASAIYSYYMLHASTSYFYVCMHNGDFCRKTFPAFFKFLIMENMSARINGSRNLVADRQVDGNLLLS
jgi:hypothetical protein